MDRLDIKYVILCYFVVIVIIEFRKHENSVCFFMYSKTLKYLSNFYEFLTKVNYRLS